MKGKFELAITFECETQEEFDRTKLILEEVEEEVIYMCEKGEFIKCINGSKSNLLDTTNSEGDRLFGNFNPTGDPFVEELKERCARVYDLIDTLETKDRVSAMIKTAAQTSLLHAQMDAVKVKFIKTT